MLTHMPEQILHLLTVQCDRHLLAKGETSSLLLSLLQVVIPQKNHRKVTTAPGNKVGGKKHLAPMFAEKLIPPRREGATGAKLPRDRRSAKLEGGHEERCEDSDENEGKNSGLDQGQEGRDPFWGRPWCWL